MQQNRCSFEEITIHEAPWTTREHARNNREFCREFHTEWIHKVHQAIAQKEGNKKMCSAGQGDKYSQRGDQKTKMALQSADVRFCSGFGVFSGVAIAK